jgi:UDP-GlcNAc3NAcA epimerase
MKLAPLYQEIKNRKIDQSILHTGQHFDYKMSSIFFNELDIPEPDYNLNINSLSHGSMTGRMIEQIENIFLETDFDYVIVYGDTNSTLAGAIAAKKLGIKVVHIEAGVRNNDDFMPEEINRVLTDRIADILLCATEKSYNNLIKEGYLNFNCQIKYVGDLMLDCTKVFKDKIKEPLNSDFVLVTCHRAGNTTLNKISNIISALNKINTNQTVLFSVHPRTRKIIDKCKIKPEFECIDPVGYFDFLGLLKNCKYLITDSGGAVREAYFFKKPSLLLLEDPLWPELVEAKVCINCNTDKNKILESFLLLEKLNCDFKSGIFGDGNSRSLIVNSIFNYDNR